MPINPLSFILFFGLRAGFLVDSGQEDGTGLMKVAVALQLYFSDCAQPTGRGHHGASFLLKFLLLLVYYEVGTII